MENAHRLERVKACPVCGETFSGRLNKVYCRTACRTLYNNDLARERRLEEKRIAGGLLRNHQILKTLLDEAGQDRITMDTGALGALGFDRNAPSGRAVVQDRPCYLFDGIAISVNEANNRVTILKIK